MGRGLEKPAAMIRSRPRFHRRHAAAGAGEGAGDGVGRSSHPVRRLRQEGLLILLAVFALAIPAGDLLVVDWMGAAGDRPRAIMNFIFDGGVLADPGAIRLQEEELDDARFLGWAEAEARMPGTSAAR